MKDTRDRSACPWIPALSWAVRHRLTSRAPLGEVAVKGFQCVAAPGAYARFFHWSNNQPFGTADSGNSRRRSVLIVATDKCRTTANPLGKLQDGPIDLIAKLNHGFSFIKVPARKELGCSDSKSVLRGDEDLTCVLSAACQVEQAEQHTGGPNAQELIEVARHAHFVVQSGDISAP